MVYHHVLDATFGALADPTRRAILSHLAGGERSISDLAAEFPMTVPAVRKHVGVLERAGLVRVQQHGRERRARLHAQPMRTAMSWMERYRPFWEFQFDQIHAFLSARSEKPPAADRRTGRKKSRKPRGRREDE